MNSEQYIQFREPPGEKKAKRILVIRLQATGDVIIMLPYIQSLRSQLSPDVCIDLLVREECADIPAHLTIFNEVHVLKGGRNTKLQLMHFLLMLPKLRLKNYDVLLDLQNHRLSGVMRKLLGIKTFSVFDRTSANYAGDRYKNTINVLSLPKTAFQQLNCFKNNDGDFLFEKFKLPKNYSYIVINPGGAFKNRNWELKNYVEFCQLWQKEMDATNIGKKTKFLLLGINKIRKQANYLKEELGDGVIDLVDKTSQVEAMQLLRKVRLTLSEDSGLLHMSYVVGTPSIGILGSTRNDWTNPNLPHTHYFHSSGLPCGNCMMETCIHNEILCMKGVKPKDVVDSAMKLLNST